MKTKIINLAKEISRLNDTEISDLSSVLLSEHDINATIYRFGTKSYDAKNGEYDVIMLKTGMRKLMVVKTIKELLGLGLKEAKFIADSVPTPVKEFATWSEAEEIRIALEAAGARIEIKEA